MGRSAGILFQSPGSCRGVFPPTTNGYCRNDSPLRIRLLPFRTFPALLEPLEITGSILEKLRTVTAGAEVLPCLWRRLLREGVNSTLQLGAAPTAGARIGRIGTNSRAALTANA